MNRPTRLQLNIYDAFLINGDMTDEQLIAQFSHLKESSVRTRRNELTKKEVLVKKGEAKNSQGRFMSLWGIPTAPRKTSYVQDRDNGSN